MQKGFPKLLSSLKTIQTLTIQTLDNYHTLYIFGERHDDNTVRETIIKDITNLKEQGLETVFLECIPKTMQGVLDKCCKDNNFGLLAKHLDNKWGHNPDDYLDFMKICNNNEIKLVGIDTKNHSPFALDARNELWAKVITENNHKKNALVLCGALHIGEVSRLNTNGEGFDNKLPPNLANNIVINKQGINEIFKQEGKTPPFPEPLQFC